MPGYCESVMRNPYYTLLHAPVALDNIKSKLSSAVFAHIAYLFSHAMLPSLPLSALQSQGKAGPTFPCKLASGENNRSPCMMQWFWLRVEDIVDQVAVNSRKKQGERRATNKGSE